jgi:curved DNA-binding protein CbpA
MTDYFALLQQPRQPWLDLEKIKEKYQQLTLASHPDRQRSTERSLDFAEVNEAYRVLSDPKLRLQHLLQLQGFASSGADFVPNELINLFSEIGTLIAGIDRLLEHSSRAQNALERSLLQSDLLSQQEQTQVLLDRLKRLQQDGLQELRSLNDPWATAPDTVAMRLGELYRRFAYLTRWINQLEERQFQLSA